MDKCEWGFPEPPPGLIRRLQGEGLLPQSNLRDFIRDNFGLYHPPGDYAALRRENLRRTAASKGDVPR